MSIWPPSPGSLGRPAYRALAQTVIDAVAAGELPPGSRLPPHRALAFELGVSVQTVSRAYEELSRLGIVSGEVGRGSFIRAAAGETRTPWHRIDGSERVIDLSMMTPVLGTIHARRFATTLTRLAGDVPDAALFSFRPTATLQPHCEQAVRWLARCGVAARPDLVIPTNGSTSAMTVALMAATVPGDQVICEAMSHHTLKALTGALGLRLTGLPADANGLLPEPFDRAARSGGVRAVYLMPEGLGPLAQRMDVTRRMELVDVARKHDIAIIENDAWGPLLADRAPPFATLAPERTLYFTGLTKCCLPGLRIAWLVAPDRMATAARTRHLVANWMATALIAEIASRWIADGTAAELLAWQREALATRNDLARSILQRHPMTGTPAGLHVWIDLPPTWSETAFVTHARQAGVAVAGGSAFVIAEEARTKGIRICLGGPGESDLAEGLRVVARLADSPPEPAHLTY